MSVTGGAITMFYGDFEFNPTPLFSESVDILRDAKGDQLVQRTSRDFTGILLEITASGTGFTNVFAQKEELRVALASGDQQFVIKNNGVPIVSGFPRVNNVTFDEGTWSDRIAYTFSTEEDETVDGGDVIQSYTETWNFEELEDNRTVTVSHDVNAVGIDNSASGLNNALTNARVFVLGRTGYTNVPTGHPAFVQASGTLTDPAVAYEELRTENVDPQQGSYGISERFTLSSGNFVHTRTGQLSRDNAGVSTVTLTGNVRGLGRKGDDLSFTRALAAFNDRVRPLFAADASGVYSDLGGGATLFTTNTSQENTTKNRFVGTIDYSVAFTDDPADNLPSGIFEFNITCAEQDAIRIFASTLIPERNLGPVVQDVATSNEGTFTVQGNAVGEPNFSFANLLSFIEDQINAKRPDVNDYQTLRTGAKNITKDETNNTVQFSFQWVFTKELSQVFGDASAPVVVD